VRPAATHLSASAGSRIAKHLEGWQVGAITVLMAILAVAVIVPRTVIPAEVPLPRLAPRDVAASRARARAEARALERGAVSDNIQILASRLRAHGLAEHAGDRARIQRAAESILELSPLVAATEPERLLDLRAHLAERFVEAFFVLLRTGTETEDLAVVGGDVARTFRDKGWLEQGDEPELDLVLRSLYKRRFASLVLPKDSLPLDETEERARVRFLILHPPRAPMPDPQGLFAGQFVLSQLDDAAAVDRDYPLRYAQGIALFRLGRYEASAAAFDAFLSERPDGPYRLRAVNYLKASVEYAAGGD
jgi:hypothetical protein